MTESPVWKWFLCKTSNLAQIVELNSAHSRNLQLMLNQPGTATFWLHLEDEKTKYVEEHKTCIVCYRNGKAVWSGPVYKCVENADNTSNATLNVTAMGWFELFNKRIVHTGIEWEEMAVKYSGRTIIRYNPKELKPSPTKEEREAWEKEREELLAKEIEGIEKQYGEVKSAKEYNPIATESALQLYYGRLEEPFGIPRNEIAVDLINRANIDVPTGVTIGLNPECSSLNYTVPQFHPVGELLTQLTSIENSFDFNIDPLTRKFNMYFNRIKENSEMKGLGQDRGQGVRFTYPGNCISANRSADGTRTQNRTEVQGQYGVGKAEDISSVNEEGLFEKSESLTDVVNIDILIAYAAIQTETLKRPFKVLTFNPRAVSNSESYSVPRPFEDYEIGDIVYSTISKGPRFQVGYPTPQPVRIFGFNLAIDDNGTEHVTGIQTVYSS